MRLLLISNSTNAGEAYLAYPMPRIGEFLRGVREVAFVPYAAVTFSYADYERRVQARFSELGIRVRSVHRAADPAAMIRRAEAICVGGGNTFALAKKMQEQGLMRAIRNRVKAGVPYVGWSAGSNVACPAISTTNDMPIVEPESFRAVGAVKFQINPHYLDANPEGHAGAVGQPSDADFQEGTDPLRGAAGRRSFVSIIIKVYMMTIREIESGSDIMEVNRLAGLIWHEAYRGIVSREQIAYMIERFQSVRAITEQLALEGYRYFLMEDEGRAVGYCGVQPRDGRLFLSKVYLLHEVRGQGRFRQMLEYLRGLCREVGARTIWLTVNRRNERAIGAYRRTGFREVRAQVTDIGGGYVMDDYVMELETTPQKE